MKDKLKMILKKIINWVYGYDISELNPCSIIDVKYYSEIGMKPFYATDGSVGFDLVADLGNLEYIELAPGESIKISTGMAIELPYGTEGRLTSRSGLSGDREIILLNGVGEIDYDYRGIMKVPLKNMSNKVAKIYNKERIAQLIICRVIKANLIPVDYICDLSETERGSNGFGSTGSLNKEGDEINE